MIFDITRMLAPATPAFPGDPPVVITPVMQIAKGDACNVSAISMSVHAGTHVDAARHYAEGAPGADALDLRVLISPAYVVSLPGVMTITPEVLSEALAMDLKGMAVLIHTRASEAVTRVFDPVFSTFTPQAAEWLRASGVHLIGTDAPSVDPVDSTELPAHKAFGAAGLVIVENLILCDVPDGLYQLAVLPLKISDADGAPARAVLISKSAHNWL